MFLLEALLQCFERFDIAVPSFDEILGKQGLEVGKNRGG